MELTKEMREALSSDEILVMEDILAQIPAQYDAYFTSGVTKLFKHGQPKFKYYVTSLNDGNVTGTNDQDVAENLALSEDNWVVNVQSNKWLQADLDEEEVEEARDPS